MAATGAQGWRRASHMQRVLPGLKLGYHYLPTGRICPGPLPRTSLQPDVHTHPPIHMRAGARAATVQGTKKARHAKCAGSSNSQRTLGAWLGLLSAGQGRGQHGAARLAALYRPWGWGAPRKLASRGLVRAPAANPTNPPARQHLQAARSVLRGGLRKLQAKVAWKLRPASPPHWAGLTLFQGWHRAQRQPAPRPGQNPPRLTKGEGGQCCAATLLLDELLLDCCSLRQDKTLFRGGDTMGGNADQQKGSTQGSELCGWCCCLGPSRTLWAVQVQNQHGLVKQTKAGRPEGQPSTSYRRCSGKSHLSITSADTWRVRPSVLLPGGPAAAYSASPGLTRGRQPGRDRTQRQVRRQVSHLYEYSSSVNRNNGQFLN